MAAKLRFPAVQSAVLNTSSAGRRSTAQVSAPSTLSAHFIAAPRTTLINPIAKCPGTTNLTPVRTIYHTATMSSMPATHGHNEACCNIPPVVESGYAAKGSYEQFGGMRTYVAGPTAATRGIISIFDIFGYMDQTVQGADILATKAKVFMPDWFSGNPCPTEWFPPDTEEKQKLVGEFFNKNKPNGVADALPDYVKALQAAHPAIQSWGIIGFCWGGKAVELVTSGASNPFGIAAAAHPTMVDSAMAGSISVPYILLASQEEPADTIKEFESKLEVPHHVEVFGDQVHGWMAARANLTVPRVREEYTRGYQTVLRFFDQEWK
ncbi:dienelactone hydrolase family protein [Apiospora kogelbergensis]|uniref:dienelactone hydrolase family protein n=1 Tax=Apiospora kogelbergensis TaxID=1337665 RepID=UPI0031327326